MTQTREPIPDSWTRLIDAVVERVTNLEKILDTMPPPAEFAEQIDGVLIRLEKLERGLNDLQQWGSGAQVQLSSLERKVDEYLTKVSQRFEQVVVPPDQSPSGYVKATPLTREDEQSAMLFALAEVWERYPSLRLGQLIQNVMRTDSRGVTGVYHFGDKMMLEALECYPDETSD